MSPNWRIYYADYTTFDSLQGEPWDAPATRVILILQKPQDPREASYFQWEDDYYLWKHGRWFAHSYGVLLSYWFIEKYSHSRACLQGETVSNKDWMAIREIAKNDKDFFE